jgi:D-glycero-beta-D-manno-heptose-7-phosphate kinase
VRVDREEPPRRLERVLAKLAAKLPALVRRSDGVVLEDYGKGVIAQGVVDGVLAAAHAAGIPVGLDPKDSHELSFSRLTLATPNYAEACSAAGLKPLPLEGDLLRHATLRAAGDALLAKWHCDLLIITLGQHGMYLRAAGAKPLVIPARAREVFDVSGAGDTVIAAAMLGLASGAGLTDAAAVANYAAGVVVGKVGTATCTPAELLAYMK